MAHRWHRFTGRSNRPYDGEDRATYLRRIATEGVSNAGQGSAMAAPIQELFREVVRLREDLDRVRRELDELKG